MFMRTTITKAEIGDKAGLVEGRENRDDRLRSPTRRGPVHPDSPASFARHLEHLLGADPAILDWPQEFQIAGAHGLVAAIYDPHNALLVFHGVRPADFAGPALRPCLTAGAAGGDLCSRLLVFAPGDQSGAWSDLGFQAEATIDGYWADGSAAQLWARSWWGRATDSAVAELVVMPTNAAPVNTRPALPADWLCRAAEPDDAPELSALLSAVFTGYPIPADPGAIRYALASGGVHGRLIRAPDGTLAAYASAEFQPGAGSVEITDCATAPTWQGLGLMTHLVVRLQEDLTDVFECDCAHALARVDQPAMQRVFARLGWARRGRLVNHFRVGEQWVSAQVWGSAQS